MPAPRVPAYTWLLLIPLSLLPARGACEVYRWVDESGGVHFVQDMHQVPERYRTHGTYAEVSEPPADVEKLGKVQAPTPDSTEAKLQALIKVRDEISLVPNRSLIVCGAALLITGFICFRYLFPALSTHRSRDEEPWPEKESPAEPPEERPKRKPTEPITL